MRFLKLLVVNLIAFYLLVTMSYSWAYYGQVNTEGMSAANQLLFGSVVGLGGFLFSLACVVAVLWLALKAKENNNMLLAVILAVVVVIVVMKFGLFGWIMLPEDGLGMAGLIILISVIVAAIEWLIVAPRAPRLADGSASQPAPAPRRTWGDRIYDARVRGANRLNPSSSNHRSSQP